jgi:Tfp pilus assembly protein PilF
MVKVWGTAETSDESISRTVYRLQVAMQSSGGPEVVETVYNSGFRVIVPVREVTMKESSSLNSLTHSMRSNAIAARISAREFLARQSVADIEVAASAVRLAISLDPSFSAAWATLAEIWIFQAIRSLRSPGEAGWLAKEAAQTALNIDPQSASALSILGLGQGDD